MKTCLILVAFSLLCLAFPVDSQQPIVGLIQGTVKNQQGAPVPNASVTATNLRQRIRAILGMSPPMKDCRPENTSSGLTLNMTVGASARAALAHCR